MVNKSMEPEKAREKTDNLLQRLRDKMLSFKVVDLKGQVLGEVVNFRIDNKRHLTLVISQPSATANSPQFLLSSEHIERVDPQSQSVFVDLVKTDFEHLSTPQTLNNQRQEAAENLPVASTTTEENSEHNYRESEKATEILEEEIIRLLEERLVVNRSRRKVGEVVVRKQVETEIVKVPVRREKLIVERVGSETETLTEIDLGRGQVNGLEPSEFSSSQSNCIVSGEFLSPQAASEFLGAIALQNNHGCAKIRVELVLEKPEFQEGYQQMFKRCSGI